MNEARISASPQLKRSRILVVDDEPANITLMTWILGSAGYENVITTTEARDVLGIVADQQPDLVILDIHMPHIDGLTLLRSIRLQTPPLEFLPVLILTADATRQALRRALEEGANDFLSKPLDIHEVLLRVGNLLRIRISHVTLVNTNSALASELMEQADLAERDGEMWLSRVENLRTLAERRPTMVFQPIVDLVTSRTAGVEALARFDTGVPPDHIFAEAAKLGLAMELEVSAIDAAVAQCPTLPEDTYLAINLSPSVLLEREVQTHILGYGIEGLVIELTEQQSVEDYGALEAACDELRTAGIRIAVDDAGAGYASFHHILRLAPDIIKLDIALTSSIDSDPVKRALATALLHFADDVGADVIAEGIETESQLETLRSLDVPWGQGFHLGHPKSPKDLEGLIGVVKIDS